MTVEESGVVPMPASSNYYRLFVECDNCGWRGHREIVKGYPLRGMTGAKCPRCECRTLSRTAPTRWDMPFGTNADQGMMPK